MYQLVAYAGIGWIAGNVLAVVVLYVSNTRNARKAQSELDRWFSDIDTSWEAYVADAQAVTDVDAEPADFDGTWQDHFWHEENGYAQLGCQWCHRGYNVDVGRVAEEDS